MFNPLEMIAATRMFHSADISELMKAEPQDNADAVSKKDKPAPQGGDLGENANSRKTSPS